MTEHRCIQQQKITLMCSETAELGAVQEEHGRRIGKLEAEIFEGDKNLKTRMKGVEAGFSELEKVIRSTSAWNRWVISGLIMLQLAATGGLYAMMSRHIEAPPSLNMQQTDLAQSRSLGGHHDR